MSTQPNIESRPPYKTLQEILKEMSIVLNGNEYFAVTLTATADGTVECWTQTEFDGFTETTPPRELRKPCLVDGNKILELWRSVGTPGLVVNTHQHLAVFLRFGGHAIVETNLAHEYFSEVLKPKCVVPTGLCTTTCIENIDESALQRAPSRKLRMRVLKRDRYRCRICGRRPASDVDIELQVHHFRPWAKGGLTIENNLITLCHTCHAGLDPHFDMMVANVFPEAHDELNKKLAKLGTMAEDHIEAVGRYREIVRNTAASRQSRQS